jgi:hypothetical protein
MLAVDRAEKERYWVPISLSSPAWGVSSALKHLSFFAGASGKGAVAGRMLNSDGHRR